MQRSTRSLSFCWSQALKKSACMVEYVPEESFTVPGVVGMANWKFVWSIGTGYGWVLGHCLIALLSGLTESTICERWSALSSSGCPLEFTARQSGNLMRTPNLPLSHFSGGDVFQSSFRHLHSTFLPCTVTIFSPSSTCPSPLVSKAGWGFTLIF